MQRRRQGPAVLHDGLFVHPDQRRLDGDAVGGIDALVRPPQRQKVADRQYRPVDQVVNLQRIEEESDNALEEGERPISGR